MLSILTAAIFTRSPNVMKVDDDIPEIKKFGTATTDSL